MHSSTSITNFNEYELVKSPDEFVEAISALAKRTEDNGHMGVLSYRFFVDRKDNKAAAIIVYADGEAWIEHHKIAYQWPEMTELQSTVKLLRLTFLGPRDDAVSSAIENAGLTIPVVWLDEPAAGFDR